MAEIDMLDLLDYNDIMYHIKAQSKIFKLNSKKDWIQVLCPYCDDAIRKESISHGHFYISRFFNFGQCFRCDTKTSVKKLLIDIGFENRILLNNIFKNNLNINYSSELKQGLHDEGELLIKHDKFQQNHLDDYRIFVKYLHKRIGNVDFSKFFVYPTYVQNKLCVAFNNALNEVSTIRFINDNNIKYYKVQNSVHYFFQKDNNFKEIVICEGTFDLINLYKYSTVFNNKNTLYIAINGRNYNSSIANIIANEFIIGKYTFNVVFDNGIKYIDSLKNQINLKSNLLNPDINVKFFIPTVAKDVSEFNLLSSI